MVVDGTRKFSGTKSLRYKTAGGGRVMLKFTQQFPIDNQHGRLMVYVPNKIASNNHWDMIQSHSSNPNHWELGGMYGNFELVVDPPDNGIDSKTPFPFGDKWHCIQWNFKHPDGLFVAKLNGQPVDPGPVMGRWKSGRWTDLTIGWEIFGSYTHRVLDRRPGVRRAGDPLPRRTLTADRQPGGKMPRFSAPVDLPK